MNRNFVAALQPTSHVRTTATLFAFASLREIFSSSFPWRDRERFIRGHFAIGQPDNPMGASGDRCAMGSNQKRGQPLISNPTERFHYPVGVLRVEISGRFIG